MDWDQIRGELRKLPMRIRGRVSGYVGEAHERGDSPQEDLGARNWRQVIHHLAYYERTGKIPPGAEELIRDYKMHVRAAHAEANRVGVKHEEPRPVGGEALDFFS